MKQKNKIRCLLIFEGFNRQDMKCPEAIKQNKRNVVNILLFGRKMREFNKTNAKKSEE
jgi:hypothetical protein